MAFFDKVSATLSKAGDSISNATSKAQQSLKTMQAINSLNGQIAAQQEAIHSAYVAIGKAYAQAHRDDAAAEYAEQVTAVAQAEAAIAGLQAQIAALKGFTTCPGCGAQIPASSAFCPGCGAKAPAPAEEVKEEEAAAPAFCPNCGAQLENDAAFCASCGAKIG